MPIIQKNITKNALRANLNFATTGAAVFAPGGINLNVWALSDANGDNSVILPWNPSFDADSDTNIEGVVNISLNVGASQSFIQPMGINSPVREIGMEGGILYVDRKTRHVLIAIYRRQFIDGYMIAQPRTPYTGQDDEVRAFMHPLKFKRTMLAAGDLFSVQFTLTYIDVPDYD